MTADEKLLVEITVYNDSDLPGKETVMLYMRDLVGSNSRPVQQLMDFQKVAFAAYERITLTFTVTEEMLRFWNNENILASEPGTFELSTGYADHLQHTKRFELV